MLPRHLIKSRGDGGASSMMAGCFGRRIAAPRGTRTPVSGGECAACRGGRPDDAWICCTAYVGSWHEREVPMRTAKVGGWGKADVIDKRRKCMVCWTLFRAEFTHATSSLARVQDTKALAAMFC